MVPPLKNNMLDVESDIASILKTVLNQDRKIKLFYPANFYPGKNHKILIPLAELIMKNNDEVVIFITLPNNCEFMKEVRLKHLEKIIINLEYIDNNQIDKVYQLVDCLFFPSYVESYGMPYVEAIKNSIPIITADYDFSREICGNAAIFFKQNCIESLHQALRQFTDTEYFGRLKVAVNNEKSRFEHDWATVINEIFPRQPWY
jgi:glycosyltransferase involved in cell wall biosynthesis